MRQLFGGYERNCGPGISRRYREPVDNPFLFMRNLCEQAPIPWAEATSMEVLVASQMGLRSEIGLALAKLPPTVATARICGPAKRCNASTMATGNEAYNGKEENWVCKR